MAKRKSKVISLREAKKRKQGKDNAPQQSTDKLMAKSDTHPFGKFDVELIKESMLNPNSPRVRKHMEEIGKKLDPELRELIRESIRKSIKDLGL